MKPMHPCNHLGCPELIRDGSYCDKHKKVKEQYRGSAAKRGYGSRWQKYRLTYLREHPLCVECSKEGRVTAATDVDHINPVNGPSDPMFWDPKDHQALCHSHHSEKTARENGGFGNPIK